MLRDSVNLLMDSVPEGIDPEAISGYLAKLPGVTEVHDRHIWAMSTTETALTANLVKPKREDEDDFLSRIAEKLREKVEIVHTTILFEREGGCDSCEQADPEKNVRPIKRRDAWKARPLLRIRYGLAPTAVSNRRSLVMNSFGRAVMVSALGKDPAAAVARFVPPPPRMG